MSRPRVVTFNSASLDGRVAASRDRLLMWGDEPGVVGGLVTPSLFDSPALGPEENPVRLELVSALVATGGAGGQVWLRYRTLR
jgi:hypothetical protein